MKKYLNPDEDTWAATRGEDIYITGASSANINFIAHARQDVPAPCKFSIYLLSVMACFAIKRLLA